MEQKKKIEVLYTGKESPLLLIMSLNITQEFRAVTVTNKQIIRQKLDKYDVNMFPFSHTCFFCFLQSGHINKAWFQTKIADNKNTNFCGVLSVRFCAG